MNEQKVQQEIKNIIEAQEKDTLSRGQKLSKQYRIAKHQETTLLELGILHLMPTAKFSRGAYIGHSDAKLVIAAAQDAGGEVGGMTTWGEGDYVKTSASTLYTLLDETTVRINKGNWSGENTTLIISDKMSGSTPDFDIDIKPTDNPDIFRGYILVDETTESEHTIILDRGTYLALGSGITREADNPVIAVAKLAYNIL